VDGLDNDPLAVHAARGYWEGSGSPGGANVTWAKADVLASSPERSYDFVLGNLFSDILRQAMPAIRQCVRAEGTVILSGILGEQADAVISAAAEAGLRLDLRVDAGPWTTLRLTVAPSR